MSDPAFETILRALPIGSLLLDKDGVILVANDKAARLAGRTAQELNGAGFFEAYRGLNGLAAAESDFHDGALHGSLALSCVTRPQAQGASSIRVHLRAPSLSDPFRVVALFEALPTADDLHRRIQHLEDRLERVGVIHHEINNVLMGLMGYAELLDASSPPDEETRGKARKIIGEIRRTQKLVIELRKIAHDT